MPGALVNPDATMSAMLADRVRRAAELYRAGKVTKILVSGDHGRGSWAPEDPLAPRLRAAPRPDNASTSEVSSS